ncbi:UNVERIFIED_CONTAM: hypothetical protein RMT77_005225 [Armadillidium vulgare]
MVFVWIFSALYSFPRFLYFEVATYPVAEREESMCILRRDLFDTRAWDIVSLLLLYLLPLILLSFLYSRIARTLYKSSRLLSQASNGEYGTFATKSSTFCCRPYLKELNLPASSYTDSSSGRGMDDDNNSFCHERPKQIRGSFKSVLSSYISFGSVKDDKNMQKSNVQEMIPLATRDGSLCSNCNSPSRVSQHSQQSQQSHGDEVRSEINLDVPEVTPKRRLISRHSRVQRPIVLKPSPMVLKARRKVIQMLIMVVVCFALCSLPFHARKMFQYFLPVYNHTAPVAYLLTPITFLFMYSHSAVNPLLYTAMSRRFRASLRDLFWCRSLQGGRKARYTPRSVIIKVEGDKRVASQLL